MTDHETITVALAYAALALVGPFILTRLFRWAESDDAQRLATEIGYAIEGVVR
jgi:Kef-type K+ transport system membrane component KefB